MKTNTPIGFDWHPYSWAALVLLPSWAAFITAAALEGVFDSAPGQRPVAILVALAAPLVTASLLLALSRSVRDWALQLDIRPLILLHAFRTVGLAFLMLAAFGHLPLVFALPAGLGDAIAAIGALGVAVGLYSRRGVSRLTLASWNVFGIADFLLAVAIGTLSRAGEPLHDPGLVDSSAMGGFPLALIPAFVVPAYLISHLLVALHLGVRHRGDARIVLGTV